jgi:hypothetical protein
MIVQAPNLTGLATAIVALAALALAVAAGSFLIEPPERARADEPVITYQFPEEGDALKEPPFVLQMCFQRPVNVKDLDKGGDFHFRLTRPDRFGLGMRIVFQPDGYGVAIYPGLPSDPIPEGQWTWEYRLTDDETLEATEGVVTFSVDSENGEEIIQVTPPSCSSGATPGPTPVRPGTPGPGETPDPDATPGPPGAGGGGNGDAPGGAIDDTGGDTDRTGLVLLTLAGAGVAAVIATLGYLVRRRLGWWLHKPGGTGATYDEHH